MGPVLGPYLHSIWDSLCGEAPCCIRLFQPWLERLCFGNHKGNDSHLCPSSNELLITDGMTVEASLTDLLEPFPVGNEEFLGKSVCWVSDPETLCSLSL